MAKQSKQDRELRLSIGGCPVHGIDMSQKSWDQNNGNPYSIVECPRNDCDIRAKAYSYDGPWELMPEFEYLLQK